MSKMTKAWLIVAAFAIFTATARADEVTEWNQTMLRAGTMAQTTPLQITRVAAIVQAAMFDAANGINARYTPFASVRPRPLERRDERRLFRPPGPV